MSRIILVLVVLTLSGCSSNTPPNANNPPPGNPSAPNPPAAVAKEDLTPPDTALKPVEFLINEVKYTIDAPEGAVVEQPGPETAKINFGQDSQLYISGPSKFDKEEDKNPVVKSIKWWKEGGGIVKPVTYLIDEPDEFLVESKHAIDEKVAPRRYVMKCQKKFGDYYLAVDLQRQGSFGGALDQISTKEECLLALKCARTIKVTAK